LRGRPTLAASVATLAIALLVLLPGSLLALTLARQGADTVRSFADAVKSRNIRSASDLITEPHVARALEWIQVKAGVTPAEVVEKATEVAKKASTALAAWSANAVVSLLDTAMTFVVTLFVLFFLFRDGAAIQEAAAGLLPVSDERRQNVIRSFRVMLQSIFKGSLLCALVQGATGGMGWAIAGLPSPVLAGAAMAVLSLLPVGGTAIVWLPGAIWLWASGHRGAAIFLALWGVIVASFLADNVLRPLLIRDSDELSTLVVFLGVFGGLSAFGLLGIFIGPIALAFFFTLLGILRELAEEARVGSPAGPGPAPATAPSPK
jgi:predicted PurR-regulated permease PerM